MEWGIVYYANTRGGVPAEAFLDACPSKVDATFNAVLEAVRAAPPPAFGGGGEWEAMHGTMAGYYEIRVTGPGRRHYRLFCILDNGTAAQLAERGSMRRRSRSSTAWSSLTRRCSATASTRSTSECWAPTISPASRGESADGARRPGCRHALSRDGPALRGQVVVVTLHEPLEFGTVGQVDAGVEGGEGECLGRSPGFGIVYGGEHLLAVVLDGGHGLAQRRWLYTLAASGVADPVTQHVGDVREELRLARHLPREPARHEDLDDDRAPAQRAAVVVVRAEVDRQPGDVLAGLVAAPALALGRAEEIGEQRVALVPCDLLMVVGQLEAGGQQTHAGVDQRPQRPHIVADGRIVGVVEHVQRGLDAGTGLCEVELVDHEPDVIGRVVVELAPDVGQRPRDEHVLDQTAHVVVDVDAERVRLPARPGVLDHHA